MGINSDGPPTNMESENSFDGFLSTDQRQPSTLSKMKSSNQNYVSAPSSPRPGPSLNQSLLSCSSNLNLSNQAESIADVSVDSEPEQPFIFARPTKIQKTGKTNANCAKTTRDTVLCLIMRQDRKRLPFNFVNQATKQKTASANWTLFNHLEHSTLERNIKGTVITAILKKHEQPNSVPAEELKYESEGIVYIAKFPSILTPYIGEVIFDLRDMEDKSILSLAEDKLKELLQLPAAASTSTSSNKLTYVKKIYPSKPIPSNDENAEKIKKINAMTISIECSSLLPQRIYFESVSLPVRSYIRPPTRCYSCQRYGHGALSCCRTAQCSKCGSKDHQITLCEAEEACCIFCKGPHTAASNKCPYYKTALAISAKLQEQSIDRTEASRLYSNLYNPNLPPLIRQPTIVSSQSKNQPSQQNENIQFPPLSQNITTSQQASTPSQPSPWGSSQSQIPARQPVSSQPTQKRKRLPQPQKSQIHLSQDYLNILNGTSWPGPQLPPDPEELSLPHLDSQSQYHVHHNPETDTEQAEPEKFDMWKIFQDNIPQMIDWVIQKLIPPQWSNSPIFKTFITWVLSILTGN